MRRRSPNQQEIATFILLLVAVMVGSLVILLLLRGGGGRGLAGLILSGLAAALVVYWIRELRRTMKRELFPAVSYRKKDWVYDLIYQEEDVTFVAEVPGPQNEIKVNLVNSVLTVAGGQGFLREVKLQKNLQIVQTSYNNGILNIKLRKSS